MLTMVGIWLAMGLVFAGWWTLARRKSAYASAWRDPDGEDLRLTDARMLGDLWVRTSGMATDEFADGDGRVFVLLHGLGATGLAWGSGVQPLADHGVLFVPDLLGWGRSLDPGERSFSLDDHLDAIEEALSLAGLDDRRMVIGGHSMGAMLALRLAERRCEQVDRLVTWGAPMYADLGRAISDMGLMARMFALDARPAQLACRVMCRYRGSAARMAVLMRPDVPGPVARASVQHTWPSYRGSLRSLVIDNDWTEPLDRLIRRNVSIELQWGTDDDVGNPDDVDLFVAEMDGVTVTMVEGRDHHLPFTDPMGAVVEAMLARP